VPGITISPYVKAGAIDHAILSFDSYATFIEDLFMNGARLNPAVLGIPDHRPDIRDGLTQVKMIDGSTQPLGRLIDEFDFHQTPASPLILSTAIPTHINADCGSPAGQPCAMSQVRISWRARSPHRLTFHVSRDGDELANCVVHAATSCTDTPGKGVHFYRVYSVDGQNAKSPASAAAEVDMP